MKKKYIQTSLSEYPVVIGKSIFKTLPELMVEAGLTKRVFVIIDKKVSRLYSEKINSLLSKRTEKLFYFPVAANEKSKSLTTAKNIYSSLIKNHFGRDTLVIAIGGGTIGDIGGFAASTFMRGVELVHIPTTLLAAVDSSIGGKTGINFSDAKNIVGTFYQPELVLIDTDFFNSLPEDEILSGAGEIIKYAFLSDKKFYSYLYLNFNLLLGLKSEVLEKILSESINLKSAVTAKDEFELAGLRRILNLGHTFGHAMESYFNFQINHGKAVTLGIIASLFLSYRKKIISKKKLHRLLQLPLLVKDKTSFSDFNSEQVIKNMRLDKKNIKGKLNFVLIKDIGEILVNVNAGNRDIEFALEETKKILL